MSLWLITRVSWAGCSVLKKSAVLKEKRKAVKEFANEINVAKRSIDQLNEKLEKKKQDRVIKGE